MDKITLDRIKFAHPHIRQKLLEEYTECNNKILGKGVRLRFAYVLRTPEEQHALFLKRPKVTNADSWQSIHNYGLAFDIVLLYDKDGDGKFEEASWDLKRDGDKDGKSDWKEVADYFKSKGWTYGGDWKGFKDHPHFEITFGHTWKTLKARLFKGMFIEEVIDGKKYKWVDLF